MKRLAFFAVLLFPVLACSAGREKLVLETAPGVTVAYHAEIAVTPLEQQRGLMYRTEMPENAGMLFVYPYSQKVRMWMKNTYLPLDMLFFNDAGEVVFVAENAVPLSETLIGPDAPVKAVLELNAGEVSRRKIKTGNKLLSPSVK